MHDNVSIHKKNSCKVVVSKGSINMWSKFVDKNFHMNFVEYVSTAKYVSPPLLIIPRQRFNRDVIKGCNNLEYSIRAALIFLSFILYSQSVLNYFLTLSLIQLHT